MKTIWSAALVLLNVLVDAGAATFLVTTTADSGPGSLRQALLDSNASSLAEQPARVVFNLPGTGIQTIVPLLPLPPITQSTIIDGFTQPGSEQSLSSKGFRARPTVRIDGVNAGLEANGLILDGPIITVKGLIIVRFTGHGILIRRGQARFISGNLIGLDP